MHALDRMREPLGLLHDVVEGPALEVDPIRAVTFKRPPLVSAVDLLHEGKVLVHHALAECKVSLREKAAQLLNAAGFREFVWVFFKIGVVLPGIAAALEPAVLLALPKCPLRFPLSTSI